VVARRAERRPDRDRHPAQRALPVERVDLRARARAPSASTARNAPQRSPRPAPVASTISRRSPRRRAGPRPRSAVSSCSAPRPLELDAGELPLDDPGARAAPPPGLRHCAAVLAPRPAADHAGRAETLSRPEWPGGPRAQDPGEPRASGPPPRAPGAGAPGGRRGGRWRRQSRRRLSGRPAAHPGGAHQHGHAHYQAAASVSADAHPQRAAAPRSSGRGQGGALQAGWPPSVVRRRPAAPREQAELDEQRPAVAGVGDLPPAPAREPGRRRSPPARPRPSAPEPRRTTMPAPRARPVGPGALHGRQRRTARPRSPPSHAAVARLWIASMTMWRSGRRRRGGRPS
jgi:hypothetical protein